MHFISNTRSNFLHHVLYFSWEMRHLLCRTQFVFKGSATICGCMELVNEQYVPGDGKGHLVPRTEDLPIYTTQEFNDKVTHGPLYAMSCKQSSQFVTYV